MHLLAYLPLLLPLPAAWAARSLGERLEPRAATWLLAGSALALAVFSSAALAVLAAAGVVRLPLVALVGDWSASTVRSGDSVSKAEAVLAALLFGAAAWAALRMLWRRARALAAAAVEAACLPGPAQIVVVADPAPEAYALPGLPGRVVVSTGMLGALEPGEREAMFAHESAHLTGHHYAFVAVTQFAAAANPLLRPLAETVAYTVERWADERAAAACGDRRRVARAVGKAALATRRTPTRALPFGTLGLLGLPGAAALFARRRDAPESAGPVPRRVAALLAPPPRRPVPALDRSLLPVAVTVGAVGASALSAFAAAHDLHALLELAGAR
jgi:Zn-dependent protease with chaperone function